MAHSGQAGQGWCHQPMHSRSATLTACERTDVVTDTFQDEQQVTKSVSVIWGRELRAAEHEPPPWRLSIATIELG